jgi:translation initiation factor 4E
LSPGSLFNNLLEPSRLPVGHTYSLFKAGIRPEWEDKVLTDGGEWRVQVPPNRRDYLDQYWVETVLTLIRDGFEAPEGDDIAGVVVNIRKGGNRIAIWTISSGGEDLQRSIGNQWRQAAIQSQNQMEYFTFKSLMGGGGKKRATYTV